MSDDIPIVHQLVSVKGTLFSFENADDEPEIRKIDEVRNIGLLSHKRYEVGDRISGDSSKVSIPIGEHRKRLCSLCLKWPLVKIKCREDCSYLTYCSQGCLGADTPFLDIYGKLTNIRWRLNSLIYTTDSALLHEWYLVCQSLLISSLSVNTAGCIEYLHSSGSKFIDSLLLAFRLMYTCRHAGRHTSQYEHILRLEAFPHTIESELEMSIEGLFASEKLQAEVDKPTATKSYPHPSPLIPLIVFTDRWSTGADTIVPNYQIQLTAVSCTEATADLSPLPVPYTVKTEPQLPPERHTNEWGKRVGSHCHCVLYQVHHAWRRALVTLS